MDDIKYSLWLNSIKEIGPVIAKKLIFHFKTPKAIFNASCKQLMQVEGIGEQTSKIIAKSKCNASFDNETAKLNKENINVISLNNLSYPKNLKNIYDPPTLLYSRGEFLENDNNAIAIVGSRNASQYGLRVAYDLAKGLAQRGIVVVSGMARGIDTSAHRGALDGGGRTVAVLGCGLDFIYPPENKDLMKKICLNGAVVSEYPLGTIPDANNFPRRNRIISGISLGTIIVEANIKSGSLITADLALEQNREVFAVPGSIYSKTSQGTNDLIKQGAKIVTCIEDILEEFNIKVENEELKNNRDTSNLNEDEKIIWENLSKEPIHLERVMKLSGFNIGKLNTIITMLELKGLVTQLPGKQFIRN